MQALSQNLPSFNAQGYGADTAALTLSAALRGLSPNDTLVLVRRQAAAMAPATRPSARAAPTGASATADLQLHSDRAPSTTSKRSRTAPAAHMGTDAIAGVVNIILKDADHGGGARRAHRRLRLTRAMATTGSWSAHLGFAAGLEGLHSTPPPHEETLALACANRALDARFFNPTGGRCCQRQQDPSPMRGPWRARRNAPGSS